MDPGPDKDTREGTQEGLHRRSQLLERYERIWTNVTYRIKRPVERTREGSRRRRETPQCV